MCNRGTTPSGVGLVGCAVLLLSCVGGDLPNTVMVEGGYVQFQIQGGTLTSLNQTGESFLLDSQGHVLHVL